MRVFLRLPAPFPTMSISIPFEPETVKQATYRVSNAQSNCRSAASEKSLSLEIRKLRPLEAIRPTAIYTPTPSYRKKQAPAMPQVKNQSQTTVISTQSLSSPVLPKGLWLQILSDAGLTRSTCKAFERVFAHPTLLALTFKAKPMNSAKFWKVTNSDRLQMHPVLDRKGLSSSDNLDNGPKSVQQEMATCPPVKRLVLSIVKEIHNYEKHRSNGWHATRSVQVCSPAGVRDKPGRCQRTSSSLRLRVTGTGASSGQP